MGNIASTVTEIDRLLGELQDRIKKKKYFELGDDPAALQEIKANFSDIYRLLGELDQVYSLKPMVEQNPYYRALKVARKTDLFLDDLHSKNEGSTENTMLFLRYLDQLRQAIVSLLDKSNLMQDEPSKVRHESQYQKEALKSSLEISTKTFEEVIQRPYDQLVYISYAWGDEREKIVNQIDQSLQDRGIKVIRDKRDLKYKGSIKAFMEHLGHGNCVVVVISDKYLRSPNCMFELVEIADNKQFQDRVFPVVLRDALIYEPASRAKYVKYWEEKIVELDDAIRVLRPANLQGLREDVDLYDRIRKEISGLVTILSDMNALTPEMHQESNFEDLYKSIEKRMHR